MNSRSGKYVRALFPLLALLAVGTPAMANTLNQNVSWTIDRTNTTAKYRVVAYGDSIYAGYNGSTVNAAKYSAPTVDAEYLSALWNADIESVRRTKSGAVASDVYQNKIVAEKAILRRLVQAGTRIVQFGYSGADGQDVAEVVVACADGVDLVPSAIELAGAEAMLLGRPGREYVLRTALRAAAASAASSDGSGRAWDVVVLDCSPSLGVLTLNALTAANGLIIPMPCEMLSHRGVGQLLDTVADVRAILNPDLEIWGILPTLFDGRSNHAREVLADVGERYDLPVLPPPIPKTVRFAEAPAVGRSILTTARSSKGAQAYRDVATALLPRL